MVSNLLKIHNNETAEPLYLLLLQGQTIPIPDMQGLKNIVSVKSKDRLSSRLPPLRGVPNRPVDGAAGRSTLPPIGASSAAAGQRHPLPSISATFTTSQTSTNPEHASPSYRDTDCDMSNDTILSADKQLTENQLRASITENHQNELAESNRYQPREPANNKMLGLKSTPQSAMFQTTDKRTDDMPSHAAAAQVLNQANQVSNQR